jgi:hypothetical protein
MSAAARASGGGVGGDFSRVTQYSTLVSMDNEAQYRAVLRRYLLSELSEAERSSLADKYFTDEELFNELLDVENELLGRYVRKQLSTEESKRFSEYLRRLPDGASKLTTAYALMEAANELREAPASTVEGARLPFAEVVYASTSRWQGLRQWLFAEHHALRYATVVVLIALVGGLFYVSFNQWQLRSDPEQPVARSSQPEKAPTRLPLETGPHDQTRESERGTPPEEKLTQARGSEERRDNQPTRKQSESRDIALASLILTPAMRSGGTPDSLTLSGETKTVLLVIPVPQERIADYAVVLQTTSGRVILSHVRLRPRPSNGRTVSLRLSTSQLASETHKLTLVGKAADGIDIAYDYYFKIVRKQ